ncbi:hypothetical protein QYF36_020686 [Acer negundo]|nr:hypothetical protein QYF36_020686 [Acer negundo]
MPPLFLREKSPPSSLDSPSDLLLNLGLSFLENKLAEFRFILPSSSTSQSRSLFSSLSKRLSLSLPPLRSPLPAKLKFESLSYLLSRLDPKSLTQSLSSASSSITLFEARTSPHLPLMPMYWSLKGKILQKVGSDNPLTRLVVPICDETSVIVERQLLLVMDIDISPVL